MAQRNQIEIMLKEGWVSPLMALNEVGCMRFGSRMGEIREEYMGRIDFVLKERWHKYESRFGKKQYKEFRLVAAGGQAMLF